MSVSYGCPRSEAAPYEHLKGSDVDRGGAPVPNPIHLRITRFLGAICPGPDRPRTGGDHPARCRTGAVLYGSCHALARTD